MPGLKGVPENMANTNYSWAMMWQLPGQPEGSSQRIGQDPERILGSGGEEVLSKAADPNA